MDANPGGVVEGTVTVRVELACPSDVRLMLVLLRLAEAGPYTVVERFTVPAKPRTLVRMIVDWPVWPCRMLRKVGLAVMWKSGPVTLTKTLRDLEMVPLVALM